MATVYVSVSSAATQSAGTTTVAGTCSVTPTLPAGAVSGDRIIVVAAASGVAGTNPTNWTTIFKDTVVGSGAVAASTGQRYLSAYYRDYDGVWTMPAFTLASATQLSHAVAAVAVRKDVGDTFDTPTASSNATFFGTPGTAYSATTGSSFTTHSYGMLIAGTVTNDNVTMTLETVSGGGSGLATPIERADGGTATGNDVSLKIHNIPVTTGASATITLAGTLSAASEGGTIFVEQTSTAGSSSGVMFDATSPGYTSTGATSVSGTHTASGSDRVAYAIASVPVNNFDIALYTRSATYGGQAMTLLSSREANESGGNGGWIEMWRLFNPPTGAQTVQVNCSPAPIRMILDTISFKNAGSDTAATAVTNVGATTTLAITVTSAAGNQVLAGFTHGSAVTGTSHGYRALHNVNNSTWAGNQVVGTAALGTVTITGQSAAGDSWAGVGVDIAPPAAVSAAPAGRSIDQAPIYRSSVY